MIILQVMKAPAILLLAFVLCYSSFAQDKLVPASYKPIAETFGDLDKDGIDEKVIIYDMTDSVDEVEGVCRDIVIYKKVKKDWAIWHRSKNAIGGSKSGGMMGDPFGEIEIKNGILSIFQSGGSSWKWGNTDKYRFQNNDLELIGFSGTYGKPCEYWFDFDYNLSTGKIILKKEFEGCEDKENMQAIIKRENESFTHKLSNKITLQSRREAPIEIISPKYKHSFYL